jgi:hypothetical protein
MTSFITSNQLGGTEQNLTTTYKTLVNVYATTGQLRRTYVYSIHAGVDGTLNATNCQVKIDVSAMTAEGTATTVTPNPNTILETGTESGALSTSKANHTGEPTVTSNSSRLSRAFNQQGFVNWVALMDSDQIIGPAVAANGWVLRALSLTYASTVVGEIRFLE